MRLCCVFFLLPNSRGVFTVRFTNTLGQDKENELLLNSLADRKAEYGPDQLTVLNDAAFAVAQSTISA